MKAKRVGFTLPELLVGIGVVAIVAALTMPVFALAKRASRRADCTVKLHNLYLATMLYRADYEGVVYGSSDNMGLPSISGDVRRQSKDGYRCGLAPSRTNPELGPNYLPMFVESKLDGRAEQWAKWVVIEEDQTPLYVDPWHNDQGIPLTNDDLITRSIMSITLGGSLRQKVAKGDWENFSWWRL